MPKATYLIEWTDHKSSYWIIIIKGITRKNNLATFTHNGKTFGYGSLFVPVQNRNEYRNLPIPKYNNTRV
jgi:hypothetical protein